MKYGQFFLILFLCVPVLIARTPSVSGQLADSPWPKNMHDLQNTGRTSYAGPADNTVVWTYPANIFRAPPIIGPDGIIYVSSSTYILSNPDGTQTNEAQFCAISSDGALRWKRDGLGTSPAVLASDGTIYVGSVDNDLVALNSDGTVQWSYKIGSQIESSPTIGPDGTIYVFTVPGNVYALTPSGTLRWSQYLNGYSISYCTVPAVSPDGTIYISAEWKKIGAPVEGKIFALSLDGAQMWQYSFGNTFASSPTIGLDGTIYVTAAGSLHAFDPNGMLKWKHAPENFMQLSNVSPAIAFDGTVYAVVDQKIYAIDSNGAVKWERTVDVTGADFSTPVIDALGTIYLATFHELYALNRDGTVKWSYSFPLLPGYTFQSYVHAPPTIGDNATLFIGVLEPTGVSYIYAFRSPHQTSLEITPRYFAVSRENFVLLNVTLTSDGVPLENKPIVWRVQENWQWRESVATYTDSQGKATFTYTPLVASTPASVTIQASFTGDGQFAENSAASLGVIVEQLPRLKQGLYEVGTKLSYNYYYNENLVGQFFCRIPDTEIRDDVEYLKVLVDSWVKTGYENRWSNTTAHVKWTGEQMEYNYLESRSNYENITIKADYDYISRVITLSGIRNVDNIAPFTISMNSGPFPNELWLFEFSTREVVEKQILLPSYTISWGGFDFQPYPLNVENTETVTVPAGSFECYRLMDEIGASWWVTVDDEILVKYQGWNIKLELASYELPTPKWMGSRIVAIAALLGIAIYLAGMARLLSMSNNIHGLRLRKSRRKRGRVGVSKDYQYAKKAMIIMAISLLAIGLLLSTFRLAGPPPQEPTHQKEFGLKYSYEGRVPENHTWAPDNMTIVSNIYHPPALLSVRENTLYFRAGYAEDNAGPNPGYLLAIIFPTDNAKAGQTLTFQYTDGRGEAAGYYDGLYLEKGYELNGPYMHHHFPTLYRSLRFSYENYGIVCDLYSPDNLFGLAIAGKNIYCGAAYRENQRHVGPFDLVYKFSLNGDLLEIIQLGDNYWDMTQVDNKYLLLVKISNVADVYHLDNMSRIKSLQLDPGPGSPSGVAYKDGTLYVLRNFSDDKTRYKIEAYTCEGDVFAPGS